MKVYFHKFYTEAHRRWRRGAALANALEAAGVEVSLVLDSTCDVALCGAFWLDDEFSTLVQRHNEFLRETNRPRIKIVHLCWDLYPMHVHGTRSGMNDTERALWQRYVLNLRTANLILTPSVSAGRRVTTFTGSRSVRCLSPACDPWWRERPAPVEAGVHVLDVMRPYDDWGRGMVARACQRLGLPCVESQCSLPADQFQAVVRNARVLVSAYNEASTGGLTLVEGYALGRRVLASNSRWNGAQELFGERATLFPAGSFEGLCAALRLAWDEEAVPSSADVCTERAVWVDRYFSDAAMATSIARELRKL